MAQETAPAKPLYDVHTHVLFDIDDSAANEGMALDMLRLASERGVTGVVQDEPLLPVEPRPRPRWWLGRRG